jgi:mRNA-degrading endonuclease RelE of RelBE toxin-antitoxin system
MRIEWSDKAITATRQLFRDRDQDALRAIGIATEALVGNPYPPPPDGIHHGDYHRLHVGPYRVHYVIDGMGGIGKTALAIRAAHRLAGRYPDGQLFIDLHGFTQGTAPPRDPGDALATLLSSLGVPPGQMPGDLDARAALYRDRLAGTRTLILLDNAADEARVRPLLPAASTCLVLATSRRRLKAFVRRRSACHQGNLLAAESGQMSSRVYLWSRRIPQAPTGVAAEALVSSDLAGPAPPSRSPVRGGDSKR